MYMNFLITLLVIATSGWVAYDALKNKMGNPDSNSPTPFKIAFGCLVLWVLIFPYYLFKRSKFIESAKQMPMKEKPEKGFIYAFVILSALFLGLSLRQVVVGDLPKCDSTEVVELVKSIASENSVNEFAFSGAVQKAYDTASETRFCRVEWSSQYDSGILNFKVEWYSDAKERFFVEFMQ